MTCSKLVLDCMTIQLLILTHPQQSSFLFDHQYFQRWDYIRYCQLVVQKRFHSDSASSLVSVFRLYFCNRSILSFFLPACTQVRNFKFFVMMFTAGSNLFLTTASEWFLNFFFEDFRGMLTKSIFFLSMLLPISCLSTLLLRNCVQKLRRICQGSQCVSM